MKLLQQGPVTALPAPRRVIFLCVVLLALAARSATSAAQADQTPLVIDAEHPENSVPSAEDALKNPLLMSDIVMEISARAERAEKAEDFAGAARYFRALAKAVPSRATAFARACRDHDRAGERDKALEMCRAALGKDGLTVEDSAYFVDVLLKGPNALGADELADVDALVAHLATQLKDDVAGTVVVSDLRCRVAVKIEDLNRLEQCSAQMNTLVPRDPRTFVYASILALKQQDWDRAERLIRDAQTSGLPEGAVALMQQKLDAQRAASPAASSLSSAGPVWFVLLASALLAVALTWFFQRRGVRGAV